MKKFVTVSFVVELIFDDETTKESELDLEVRDRNGSLVCRGSQFDLIDTLHDVKNEYLKSIEAKNQQQS